jgi:outer membrane protein assembly factor BamB
MLPVRLVVVAALLAAVGCDHDIVASAVPSSGSFELVGDAPAFSASKDNLVLSRRLASQEYAVEARTFSGGLLWQYKLAAGEIASAASIDTDGNIYVPVSSGVTSLTSSGQLRWHKNLTGLLNSGAGTIALGTDGRLYTHTAAFSTTPAMYYALNTETGEIVWSFSTARNAGDCVIDQQRGTVYFVSRGGATAVSAATGAVRWTFFFGGFDGGGGAIGPDGTLYVTENSDMLRTVTAISPDGLRKWSYGLAPFPGGFGPMVDADGNIYASSGSSNATYAGRGIVSLTPAGTLNWSYDVFNNASAAVLDANKTLYVTVQPALGQPTDLLTIRSGTLITTNAGGGAPFLDPFGRVLYQKASEIKYFTSGGYDPGAWPEAGRTPDRAGRR